MLIQVTLPEQDRKKNKFKNSCKNNNCPTIIHNCILKNIQILQEAKQRVAAVEKMDHLFRQIMSS